MDIKNIFFLTKYESRAGGKWIDTAAQGSISTVSHNSKKALTTKKHHKLYTRICHFHSDIRGRKGYKGEESLLYIYNKLNK